MQCGQRTPTYASPCCRPISAAPAAPSAVDGEFPHGIALLLLLLPWVPMLLVPVPSSISLPLDPIRENRSTRLSKPGVTACRLPGWRGCGRRG